MKKIYYFFILMILIIPFSGTNVFAQTLQTEATVGELKDIENSKYRASAVTEIRNENGELISLSKVVASRYLDDSILDTFLNSKPEYLIKEGNLDEQIIRLYNITVGYDNPQCVERFFETPGFNDLCNWHHRAFSTILAVTDREGVDHTVFRGLNHNEIIRSGYTVTTVWNVFTRD